MLSVKQTNERTGRIPWAVHFISQTQILKLQSRLGERWLQARVNCFAGSLQALF